jgi:hypothetical protein
MNEILCTNTQFMTVEITRQRRGEKRDEGERAVVVLAQHGLGLPSPPLDWSDGIPEWDENR